MHLLIEIGNFDFVVIGRVTRNRVWLLCRNRDICSQIVCSGRGKSRQTVDKFSQWCSGITESRTGSGIPRTGRTVGVIGERIPVQPSVKGRGQFHRRRFCARTGLGDVDAQSKGR